MQLCRSSPEVWPRVVATAVVACCALAACADDPPAGGAAPAGAAAAQRRVLTGPAQRPTDLNPFTTRERTARRQVLAYTHEALADLDPRTAALRPALARSWERDADGLGVRFTLRDDAVFADGSPLRAADVLFTHRVAAAGGFALGEIGAALRHVEAIEERDGAVHVRMREAGERAFGQMATGYLVVSRAFFEDRIAQLARGEEREVPEVGTAAFGELLGRIRDAGPGTGPYRLPRTGDGRLRFDAAQWTLERNPHAWTRAAHPERWRLDALRLLFITDPVARGVALRRQQIDWLVDPDGEARLAADPALARHYQHVVYDGRGSGRYMIVWNHRRQPFGDSAVRRALTRLFDRQSIVRDLFAGHARVPEAWTVDAPEFERDPLRFDPAAAAAGLRAAGHDGLKVRLLIASEAPEHRRITDLSAPAFARANVDLEVEAQPFATMLARLRAHDFDGILLVVSQDPWRDPRTEYHSSATDDRNWMGYASAATDRALDALAAADEPAERRRQHIALERQLDRDQPCTLLVHPRVSLLLHRRFAGAPIGALGLVPEGW